MTDQRMALNATNSFYSPTPNKPLCTEPRLTFQLHHKMSRSAQSVSRGRVILSTTST